MGDSASKARELIDDAKAEGASVAVAVPVTDEEVAKEIQAAARQFSLVVNSARARGLRVELEFTDTTLNQFAAFDEHRLYIKVNIFKEVK